MVWCLKQELMLAYEEMREYNNDNKEKREEERKEENVKTGRSG